MIRFTPTAYDETQHRLALGLEIIDAARLDRIARPISVAIDGVPLPSGKRERIGGVDVDDVLPRVPRHDSCVHALVYTDNLYRKGNVETVELRFLPPFRHFVPRRLSIPLVDPKTIDPTDPDDAALKKLRAARTRQPHLFPGAAYDMSWKATGLRGRARRGKEPLRWVRVEARVPPAGAVVGRAHGDDRGEFLLLVNSPPGPLGSPSLDLPLVVTAFARSADPVVPDFVKQHDPLWDLPVEKVTAPLGPADSVSTGLDLPAGYTVKVTRTITFKLGAILTSEVAPFVF
jgi:hypothetical protein